MIKDRSKHAAARGDFSLPKSKILRGRKNFTRLFSGGVKVCRSQYIHLRYKTVADAASEPQMAFIVKKSLGKANKRNQTKRLIREAYRLHQHRLSGSLKHSQTAFHGAFMAQAVNLKFADVERDIIDLLEQVQSQLPSV